MAMTRLTMAILGLTCGGGGALTLERALARVRGVKRVYVNPVTEMAYVELDAEMAEVSQIVTTIESAGLRASEISVR